jgi:hypothetical protein
MDDDGFNVVPGDVAVGLLSALIMLAWLLLDVLRWI